MSPHWIFTELNFALPVTFAATNVMLQVMAVDESEEMVHGLP